MAEQDLVLAQPNREVGLSVFKDLESFELATRMAKCLNSSSIVPDTYRGPQNLGSCMIALDMSARLGLSPIQVMQSLYLVKGKPSFSGQFVIALVNASGLYKTRIQYEEVGKAGTDNYGLRAWAIDHEGNKIYGPAVTIKMAKDENWWSTNKKWQNMTELMLRYRSGTLFQRTNCPELTFGVPTTEEVEDMGVKVVDIPAHEVQEVDIDKVPESIIKGDNTIEVKATLTSEPIKEEPKKPQPEEQDF
jgi:hypothetical protein